MREQHKISLASDNWSGAHPLIMQAVIDANEGYAKAYGADPWSDKAKELIEHEVGRRCKIFFVPTGTGANVFGLRLCLKPYQSVICSDIAHIHYQEAGAFEAIAQCKLLTIPHDQGKVRCVDVLKKLEKERAFGLHSTSPKVLSIAQPTEVGTVYSLQELASLSALCKENGLLLHVDGSRIYNALVCLEIELKDFIEAASMDVLSLGGTKNGLLGAEALLIFNETLEPGSDYLQKQTLQLLSKMRYTAAQYIPFFNNRLWRSLAENANNKACAIGSIIENLKGCTLSYPVQTNQLFLTVPEAWFSKIQEHIFCLPWDQEKKELRFIASWNTTDQEVSAVRSIMAKLEID